MDRFTCNFFCPGEDEEVEEDDLKGNENSNFKGSHTQLDVDSNKQGRKNDIHIEMRGQRQDPSQVLQTVATNKGSTGLVFFYLLKLRLLLMVRSKAAWIFMLVLPIGLVAGGLVLSKQSSNSDNTPQPLNLSPFLYAKTPSAPSDSPLHKFVLQDSVSK